ncbi:arylsulfatase K-like [Amphiura filiformis]|uniref:arylsulfatase K-like n=1 Tax=Amphiura filiformis TaxID=82378 RepID=UPI003B226EA5
MQSLTKMLLLGILIIILSINIIHASGVNKEELPVKLQLTKQLLTKPREGKGDQRPNIVFVICDAMDGRLVGRDDLLQMPNINNLAKNGVNFINAYTNSPICCPSRSALWSGRHTHITESWNNYKGLSKDYPTWAVLLEQAGYNTKIYGKTDYVSGSHSLSNRMEAWTRNVNFTLAQEGHPTPVLFGNESTTNVSTDWLLLPSITRWIQTNASKSSQPFLLYVGFTLPHPYNTPSSGKAAGGSTFKTSPYWLKKVNQSAVTIPKWIPLDQMHPVDYYETATKNCTSDFTTDEIHKIRAYYYAMCAETDAMFGVILDALKSNNLLQDSYVFFTADHGDLAMEHRQFYKMSMYEGSSHVPMVAMAPQRDNLKPGVVTTPVSLVDVFPTFMDIANVTHPQGLNGTSLLPLLQDPTSRHQSQDRPDYILSQYHGCNVNMSSYMLRQGDWKIVVYGDGKTTPPHLFNLATDPEELDDLVNKEPGKVKEMEQLLASIMDYPAVTTKVQDYNKQSFTEWKKSVGDKYSNKLANLRWWKDWQKAPKEYEKKIDEWLNS